MDIKIIECRVSDASGTPIPPGHPFERGLRINRVATLGAEIVILRERRLKAKKHQSMALTRRIWQMMADIIELDGQVDEQGFITLVD